MNIQKYTGLFIIILAIVMAGGFCLPAVAQIVVPPVIVPPPPAAATNDLCIKNPPAAGAGAATTTGKNIIATTFAAINGILAQIASTFYNSILNNADFQKIVNALVLLYITIYGVMIMFNLASHHTSEVVSRLVRIGIVYAVLTVGKGWDFFNTYIGNLFLGGMNDLITQFSLAGVGGGAITVADIDLSSANALSADAMSALFGPIGQVFSVKFMVMIISLFTLPNFGILMALCLIWGLIEFILMVIGAIATYVKAIVGLAFLFGVAPIFFLFLLFEKTRDVFMGWLNQVVAFALQPVMLFAFLAFYVQLIKTTLDSLMNAADYCYVKWFSMAGGLFDVYFWRPTRADSPGGVAGDWGFNPPPISFLDVIYFLLLCHLGQSFSKFIEKLSQDISGGSGPGITAAKDVGSWFKNNFTQGRGLGALGRDGFNSAWEGIASKFKGGGGGAGGGAANTVSRAAVGTGAAGAASTAGATGGGAADTATRPEMGQAPLGSAPSAPSSSYSGEAPPPTDNATLQQLAQAYKNAPNEVERQNIVGRIEKTTGEKFDPNGPVGGGTSEPIDGGSGAIDQKPGPVVRDQDPIGGNQGPIGGNQGPIGGEQGPIGGGDEDKK